MTKTRTRPSPAQQRLLSTFPVGGYYVVGPTMGYCKKPVVYRGLDAAKVLLEKLVGEMNEILEMYENPVPLKMSPADEEVFKNSYDCHICKRKLDWNTPDTEKDPKKRNWIPVRDHCHITGKFRGAAHSLCNLRYGVIKRIPVLFHNLSNYDGHILFQEIDIDTAKNITVIAENFERYIAFRLDKLVFLDSARFMTASLDTLVANLRTAGVDKFTHLTEWFPNPDEHELLLRKGVYPYDFFDDFSKFDHTSLPSKADFYNRLTEIG